jgi:hypothetical protein
MMTNLEVAEKMMLFWENGDGVSAHAFIETLKAPSELEQQLTASIEQVNKRTGETLQERSRMLARRINYRWCANTHANNLTWMTDQIEGFAVQEITRAEIGREIGDHVREMTTVEMSDGHEYQTSRRQARKNLNEGTLEVGTNGSGEVVVNHPDLKPDADGVGHIVFSPKQAQHFAFLLLKNVHEAYQELNT